MIRPINDRKASDARTIGPGGDRGPGDRGPGGLGRGGFGGRGRRSRRTRRTWGWSRRRNELMLLASEQVQKELELIDEQIKDFEKLREGQAEKMREMFAGMRDLSEDERRAKFEEMRGKLEESQKELSEKMNAILMPHQLDRLKELNIQVRGMGALDDPEVAEELKISEEQKQEDHQHPRSATRKSDANVPARRRRRPRRSGPSEEMREKFTSTPQTRSTEALHGDAHPRTTRAVGEDEGREVRTG